MSEPTVCKYDVESLPYIACISPNQNIYASYIGEGKVFQGSIWNASSVERERREPS